LPVIRRDMNELRYNAIWLLPKDGNTSYWKMLFKNCKAFFFGMDKPELSKQLDFMIREKLEKPMGTDIQSILIVYKNLPTHNSFTRSRNPVYDGMNIYKFTIEKWLDEIEGWLFQKVIELENQIRFTTPSRQFV